jgi:hydroxymethylpyrimidine pyrophosphatase-like HAD family hydrolase
MDQAPHTHTEGDGRRRSREINQNETKKVREHPRHITHARRARTASHASATTLRFLTLLLAILGTMAEQHRRLRAVFSDLDGTLCHFPAWFEEHGSRIVSKDPSTNMAVVESASGEQRDCRLLPSSTMGDGVVSERSIDLVRQLREEGVLFIIVTAARKSTLQERLPLLPESDAACCETGSRVYLADGTLDVEWTSRIEPICGPLDRELDVADRPEPLWEFFRLLQARVTGLKCDSRSYYGCFRVKTQGDATVDAALRAVIETELPESIDWAMNLGCYDFYPRVSGKGNVVAYLQQKFGVAPDECACLFDDDNDLPMAQRCGSQLLPGLTSDSVRRAAAEHPEWQVASTAGQGPVAIEECLEKLLARARGDKVAEMATR